MCIEPEERLDMTHKQFIEALEELPYLIDCIDMDYLLHLCEPHKDIVICGMKVRTKKVSSNDIVNYYSCYECTF